MKKPFRHDLVRALRIIQTWAIFDGGAELDPKRVAKLCAETLGTKTMIICDAREASWNGVKLKS